jgi:hypothetical protein
MTARYKWIRERANPVLLPDPASACESQMVEYPSLIAERGRLRLFYCGNGYGVTGIGTALAANPP